MNKFLKQIQMQHVPITFRKEKGTIKIQMQYVPITCNKFKLHLVGHGSKIEFGTSLNGCKIAFLHGNLDDEIYMNKSEGLIVVGKEKLVCKINKPLYRLKNSPRQWYKRFNKFMEVQKYTRSKYDNCVYALKLQDEVLIYLLIYVDDMLIDSKNHKAIERLKAQLNQEFEMNDREKLKVF